MSSRSRLQSRPMLLAGDVGGTKTLIGLFRREAVRPTAAEIRTYRTLDFPNLSAIALDFLTQIGTAARKIDAACFAVAGPVTGTYARLTNIPWVVDAGAMCGELSIPRTYLLNDLEALAWSVSVLEPGEIEVLVEGQPDESAGAALLAAGTGLGIAMLPKLHGRFVPLPSEGGHVDFAARNASEQLLQNALIKEHSRAELERVVSGPGLANIHRFVHPHHCATLTQPPDSYEFPALVARAALEDGCDDCRKTLELFVSAYGAAAGNLALTTLSLGGVYLGGGIAPRILPALRWPVFREAFCAKPPMEALMRRIPVKVILNPAAGLIGAATFAAGQESRQTG